eukprot:Clim_evm25s14 gene=Clim_evmTU25s14
MSGTGIIVSGDHAPKQEVPKDERKRPRFLRAGPKESLTRSEVRIEWNVCICPKSFHEYLRYVFVGRDPKNIHIIPTFQPCKNDMVGIGINVDDEKDERLEDFRHWADLAIEEFKAMGYWGDLTDPCSGMPVYSQSNSYYPDVNGAELLLRYTTFSTGCCKVLSHPKWGTKVYPATLFTDAPLEVIDEVLRNLNPLEN